MKVLSDAQVRSYNEDGYLAPLRVFDAAETREMRALFEALSAREGGNLSRSANTRPHLYLKWIDDVIRDPRVLDPVEDVLGPDILCWASGFFAKRPGDGSFISWHQDATYWGLSSNDVVTAWIALSPSDIESGCLRVVPGSHKTQVPHRDTFGEKNLLSRGQEIAVEVREDEAVDIILQPGEMSLHHVLIFHGSNPNVANDSRIGLAIRYIPSHLKQLAPIKDSAMLVRGVDRYGHFEPEQRPSADFAPDALSYHAAIQKRLNEITNLGANKPGAM
ncbi:MAG: phytanoyl-CoA dioxygenase family protein [Beijerinckiaceae bacterium]